MDDDTKKRARLILGVRPEDDMPEVDRAIEHAIGCGFRTAHGIARVARDVLGLAKEAQSR